MIILYEEIHLYYLISNYVSKSVKKVLLTQTKICFPINNPSKWLVRYPSTIVCKSYQVNPNFNSNVHKRASFEGYVRFSVISRVIHPLKEQSPGQPHFEVSTVTNRPPTNGGGARRVDSCHLRFWPIQKKKAHKKRVPDIVVYNNTPRLLRFHSW